MIRTAGILSILTGLLCFCGCGPASVVPVRTFESQAGRILVKGRLNKQRMCIQVQLKTEDRTVTLHSLQLVAADGGKAGPTTWKDETPHAPPISVGFGMGFSGGGHSAGGHPGWDETPSPARAGHSTELGPGAGFGVPLTGAGKAKITDVEACWDLAGKFADPAACTLEVNLASVTRDKIEVTTFALALTVVTTERKKNGESTGIQAETQPSTGPAAPPPVPKAEQPPAPKTEPKQPPADTDLIAEIDFTLKSPPTKKTIST